MPSVHCTIKGSSGLTGLFWRTFEEGRGQSTIQLVFVYTLQKTAELGTRKLYSFGNIIEPQGPYKIRKIFRVGI